VRRSTGFDFRTASFTFGRSFTHFFSPHFRSHLRKSDIQFRSNTFYKFWTVKNKNCDCSYTLRSNISLKVAALKLRTAKNIGDCGYADMQICSCRATFLEILCICGDGSVSFKLRSCDCRHKKNYAREHLWFCTIVVIYPDYYIYCIITVSWVCY
jgi:hypothetical protein